MIKVKNKLNILLIYRYNLSATKDEFLKQYNKFKNENITFVAEDDFHRNKMKLYFKMNKIITIKLRVHERAELYLFLSYTFCNNFYNYFISGSTTPVSQREFNYSDQSQTTSPKHSFISEAGAFLHKSQISLFP